MGNDPHWVKNKHKILDLTIRRLQGLNDFKGNTYGVNRAVTDS